MKFTNEQLANAKQAQSPEQLLALAKENGIEMTEEESKTYFAELHKESELSDDELDSIAGGKGESDPKFYINEHVMWENTWSNYWYVRARYYDKTLETWRYTLSCNGNEQYDVLEKEITKIDQ